MVDQNSQTSENNTPDTQNYNVDINEIYNKFIIEIDKIRSHLSVVDNPIFNNFDNKAFSQTNITTAVDQQIQESRCSAFYRLLGLPVTNGEQFYNPGFDKKNNNNTAILNNKINIAKSIISNIQLKNVFDARETLPKYFSGIFLLQDVEAMVLTMGLNKIRSFTIPFDRVTGIIDTNLNNQTYSNSLIIDLILKVQNNGRTANVSNGLNTGINQSNSHILAPLSVDPRIDFYVFPKRNLLSVPFAQNKSDTLLSDNIYLQRPYIEKVCRDRFDTSNKVNNYGDAVQDIIDSIKSSSFYNNNDLLKKVFTPNDITADTAQFANFYNLIRSVLVKLNQSTKKIDSVLALNANAKYNWTPIPSIEGPEKGNSTRDLLNGQANDSLNTQQDLQILNMIFNQTLSNLSSKLDSLTEPDVGGFAFENNDLTPEINSTNGSGDNLQDNITYAVNDRNSFCDAANDSARIIEIIMGEFSGLGLLDILAISSAFWLVDKSSLLSMLDDNSFQRLYTYNTNLRCPEVVARANGAGTKFTDGFLSFQNTVKEVYQLCDSLWNQIIHENVQ